MVKRDSIFSHYWASEINKVHQVLSARNISNPRHGKLLDPLLRKNHSNWLQVRSLRALLNRSLSVLDTPSFAKSAKNASGASCRIDWYSSKVGPSNVLNLMTEREHQQQSTTIYHEDANKHRTQRETYCIPCHLINTSHEQYCKTSQTKDHPGSHIIMIHWEARYT